MAKKPPANTGDERSVLPDEGQEDPLGKEMATRSSLLA